MLIRPPAEASIQLDRLPSSHRCSRSCIVGGTKLHRLVPASPGHSSRFGRVRPSTDEPVQPGADEAAIAAVRERLRSRFGATLPDAYAEFLRREDGVDVDGLVLYGSWQ